MSTKTEKLGLIKPELTDPADITKYNENWDILEREVTYAKEHAVETSDLTYTELDDGVDMGQPTVDPIVRKAIDDAHDEFRHEFDDLEAEFKAQFTDLGHSYELLWENPNPSSNYASENIALGTEVIKQYDQFCITYKWSTTNAYDQYYAILNNRLAPSGEYLTGVGGGYVGSMVDFIGYNGAPMPIRRLLMVAMDQSYIMINKCTSVLAEDTTDYSKYLIPGKIYGIKLNGFLNEDVTALKEKVKSKADGIIVEKSGTTITATDSSDEEFANIKTFGKSEQETTTGKNLLKNTSTDKESGGITLTVDANDGTITLNGTATAEVKYTFTSTIPMVSPRYSNLIQLSGSYSGTIRHTEYDSSYNGSVSNPINTPCKMNEDFDYTIFRITISSGTVCSNLKVGYIVATEGYDTYEPYTGGIASPNPEYPQPIVSAGQNLADGVVSDLGIQKKITGKNLAKSIESDESTASYIAVLFAEVDFKPDTEYTISYNGTSGNKMYPNENLFSGGTAFVTVTGRNSFTVRTKSLINKTTATQYREGQGWIILKNSGEQTSANVFKDVQIEEGSVATPYEPYTEQTLTIDKVLRGIPVTDSSLATYTDENGQMWCADYIDVERKVLVQRVTEFTVSSVKGFDSSGKLFDCGTIPTLYNCDTTFKSLLCDKYRAYKLSDARTHDYGITQYTMGIYLANKDWNFDLNTANADLSANPITVYSILAIPIETPMTDAEYRAYKTLHSNKPTTIISNDADAYMEVKYVADTTNHIKQNYVPISEFNDVLERISALERLHV